MLAREGIGFRRAALDGEHDDLDDVLLALRQLLRQLARHERRGLRLGDARRHEQRARLACMRQREVRIERSGAREGLLGLGLGVKQPVHALLIRLARVHARSLNRWIFPVAVFGSSAANSIHRGYLYGASFSLT